VGKAEAAAKIAARFLEAENPASVSIKVSKLIALVLNLRAVGALGLLPAMDLIFDATRVIK
jgi:ABC-type uncharacterized transport system substrate-binding protein